MKATGLELQADGQLGPKTRVSASYSFTQTKDDATGEPLELRAQAPVARSNMTVAGAAGHRPGGRRGAVHQRPLQRRRPRLRRNYWLVNATLFSARWKDRWEASLSAYNLFEAHYDRTVIGDLEALQDGRLLRLKIDHAVLAAHAAG